MAAAKIPIAERTVGIPILWQPSPEEDQLLRQDWEEISEQIILGQGESLTAPVWYCSAVAP